MNTLYYCKDCKKQFGILDTDPVCVYCGKVLVKGELPK